MGSNVSRARFCFAGRADGPTERPSGGAKEQDDVLSSGANGRADETWAGQVLIRSGAVFSAGPRGFVRPLGCERLLAKQLDSGRAKRAALEAAPGWRHESDARHRPAARAEQQARARGTKQG